MPTKTEIRPCHEIAAEYLGVDVRQLPPGLAWRLKCCDDRLRTIGSGLTSRQAVAVRVDAWIDVEDYASWAHELPGTLYHEHFFGTIPEGFWSDES